VISKIKNFNIKIQISLVDLALVTLFVVYGFYGYTTAGTLSNNFLGFNLLNIVLMCVFTLLIFGVRNKSEDYYTYINVDSKNIVIIIIFFLVNLTINQDYLTIPLSGDELAYSSQSMTHAIKIIEELSNLFSSLDNFGVNRVIGFINFIEMSLLFLALVMFVKIKNRFIKFFTITLVTLLFRSIYSFFGGQSGPNSPLPALPYQLFSSIFGISDLGFRVASILFLSIFQGIAWKIIYEKHRINDTIIFLSILSIVPIFRIFYLSIEISIWAFYFTTIILLLLSKNTLLFRTNILYLAAIFTYFRFSLLVVYFGILALFLLKLRSNVRVSNFNLAILSIVIVLPNIVSKRSVSEIVYGFDSNPAYLQQNILLNINSYLDFINTPAKIILSIIMFTGIILIGKKDTKNIFFLTIWVFGTILLFVVSLPNGLVHNIKYYAEWAFPFIALSIYKFIFWVLRRRPNLLFVIGIYLTILLSLVKFGNLFVSLKVPSEELRQVTQDSKSIYHYIPIKALNYRSLHLVVRENNYKCYHMGTHFRQSEILAGLSLTDYLNLRRLDDDFNTNFGKRFALRDIEELNSYGYSCLIVDPPIDKFFLEQLQIGSWEEIYSFQSFWGDDEILILSKSELIRN
jgi:hypothetical protein